MKIVKYHNAFTVVGVTQNLSNIEKLNLAITLIQNTYEAKAEIWNGGNIFNIKENLDYFIAWLPTQREDITNSEKEDRKNQRFENQQEYEFDLRLVNAERITHNY